MDLTFEIAEKRIDGVSVVTVTGEIVLATAPDLKACLLAQEADRVPAIVVDLTGVSFIDSTALGVLVGAYRHQEDAGGSFKLVVTEPRILKVLEITDLTSVFPVFASVDEGRFRRPVTPGDQLRIEVDVLNWRPLAARLEGKVYVEGKLACEATIMCAVVPRPSRIGSDRLEGPVAPSADVR